MAALDSVPEVLIDPDGVYKYILVRLSPESSEPERYRDIVRGTRSAEFHNRAQKDFDYGIKEVFPRAPPPHRRYQTNHIFEKLDPEMQALGLKCKCLGGGKIEHNSKDKKIRIFSESTGYGKANHSITAEKLRNKYGDYEVVWSDEKK